MTANEARKLIGKRITWEEVSTRWVVERSAVLAEVRGRNALTAGGDWLWLPSLPAPVKVEDVE